MEPDSERTTSDTLAAYAGMADQYASSRAHVDMGREMAIFISRLGVSASPHVLDVGCGGGRDMAAFEAAGLQTTGLDGCGDLARIARITAKGTVVERQFDQIDWVDRFDGAWACASLLHCRGEALTDAMRRIARALKPGGALYVGMKLGIGEGAAPDGRWYQLVDAEQLQSAARAAGFEDLAVDLAASRLPGVDTTWLNLFANKPF